MSRKNHYGIERLTFKHVSSNRPPQLNLTICGAKSGLSSGLASGDEKGERNRRSLEIAAILASDATSTTSVTDHTEDGSVKSEKMIGGPAVQVDTCVKRQMDPEVDCGWVYVQGHAPVLASQDGVQHGDIEALPASGMLSSVSSLELDASVLCHQALEVQNWLLGAGAGHFGDSDGRLKNIRSLFSDISPFVVHEFEAEGQPYRYPEFLEV